MVVYVRNDVANTNTTAPIVALAALDVLFVGPNAVLTATFANNAAPISLGGQNDIFVRGSIFGSGVGIVGGSNGNRIMIDAGGFVGGEEFGISLGPSSFNVITNAGTISSSEVGIAFGSGSNRVSNSGIIQGITGIDASSNVVVDNSGLISGLSFGVRVLTNAARVFNSGEIVIASTLVGAPDGTRGALYFQGTTAEVINEGSIRASGGPAIVSGSAATQLTIQNTGTIEAENSAIQAGSANDVLTNAGIITGGVVLSFGNDLYDGTQGRVLRGEVSGGAGFDTLLGGALRDVLVGGADTDSLDGGAGDDVLRPGAGIDFIDGGAGLRDLLDYAGSLAVSVNLALGEASGGDADGDEFTGIEWVAGSTLNDVLVGDAQANALFGRGGNDSLVGGAGNDVLVGDTGNDTLVGGAGVDVLRGGIGADRFVFALAAESGAPGVARDRIADFSAGSDKIDLSLIDANAALAGNQPFVFIGGAAFSAAGQVRSQVINGNTFVFANTDANALTAEFSVLLTGSIALTATDFVL